jgi:hypothetical protein
VAKSRKLLWGSWGCEALVDVFVVNRIIAVRFDARFDVKFVWPAGNEFLGFG